MTTPEPSAPEPSERAQFEAWAKRSAPFMLDDLSAHADDGGRLAAVTAWMAWQFRAALQPSPSPVVVEPTAREQAWRYAAIESGDWLTGAHGFPRMTASRVRNVGSLGDAARYRWLRERPSLIDWDSWVRPIPHYVLVTPELLDSEIDSALNPKRPEE